MKTFEKMKFMIASEAYHPIADMGRKPHDICFVIAETDTQYIGNWVSSYGFTTLRFPKITTRELTVVELGHYDKILFGG